MPEWFLVRMLSKRMDGESARVAMFGHANAPGGHDEISRQAEVFDKIIRKAEIPLVSWNKLLPYFRKQDEKKLIADKSRTIRLRIW